MLQWARLCPCRLYLYGRKYGLPFLMTLIDNLLMRGVNKCMHVIGKTFVTKRNIIYVVVFFFFRLFFPYYTYK